MEPGKSSHSPIPRVPEPCLDSALPFPIPAPYPPPASPLSVRLRKDNLRLRCRLKLPSSSTLLGEPGIMLVWNQGRRQGPSATPTLPKFPH